MYIRLCFRHLRSLRENLEIGKLILKDNVTEFIVEVSSN